MTREYQKKTIGNLDVLEVAGDSNKGTIVLLHGFGADAFDLLPLQQLYQGPTWLFPHAPLEVELAPGFYGKAWFPIDFEKITEAMRENRFEDVSSAFVDEIQQATEILENFINELGVSKSKLLLGGFSQGAILALNTLFSSPLHYGALLIFSGILINEKKWKKNAAHYAKTPFFQSHGTHDPILPFQKAEELETLLLDSGFQGGLHSFSGGHEIPQAILASCKIFLSQIFEGTWA